MRTIAGTTWSVEDAQAYIKARVKVDENGCWIWQHSTMGAGYGKAHLPRINGGAQRRCGAHRLSFEAFVGAVPPGNDVCHSCDVRRCCNPGHLWTGTRAENMRDMAKKGRGSSPPRHNKLTPEDVVCIRKSRVPASEAAVAYGVHAVTIRAIRRGSAWRHV